MLPSRQGSFVAASDEQGEANVPHHQTRFVTPVAARRAQL